MNLTDVARMAVAASSPPVRDGGGGTATNKTPGKGGNVFSKQDAPKFLPAAEHNILHNYRSWMYVWTLAAITPEAASDPSLIPRDMKRYTVLSTAGKGTQGVGISADGINKKDSTYKENKQLIEEFNKVSPGRFDMYLDGISVQSVLCASNAGGNSMATNIDFDVVEPYSVNGFIEALQVACRAAGYTDYLRGSYALRIQFIGWKDGPNIDDPPEVIPMTTRVFPIRITNVGVNFDIDGTKYRISSVPLPQMGLGTPNILKSDIKTKGNTVFEVLKGFIENVNKMAEDQAKGATDDPKKRDYYEISCPKLATVGKPQSTLQAVINNSTSTAHMSEIVNAKMNDGLKSSNTMEFGNIATSEKGYVGAKVAGAATTSTSSDPSTGKDAAPQDGTVTFAQGSRIHDCISVIIRDSDYVRNLLTPENIEKVKQSDGLVTYFNIRMELEILDEDEENNKEFCKYRYVVEPYKIHYTRIPGYESEEEDYAGIKQYIKRDYNYLYSGKNVDITKLSLNFDNLYFQGVPAMLGNRVSANSKAKQAGPNNQVEVKQNKTGKSGTASKNVTPKPSQNTDVKLNDTASAGGKAGQIQDTPYAKMAQALHDAMLNGVTMITATAQILGDPYYLITGGMINADLNLKEPMVADDGQAPTTQGDIYININFKSPIDYDPTTGMVTFGEKPAAFSGIYRITTLVSDFKDGIFTQSLDLVRFPGQVVDKKDVSTSTKFRSLPQAGQQLMADTALPSVLKSGIRPSDFNLTALLSRGLPSVGLPSQASDFTNVTGIQNSALLSQVSGVQGLQASLQSNLTSQLTVSPLAGVDPLLSGVRLQTAGLSGAVNSVNPNAASLVAAGSLINNLSPVPNAASNLAAVTGAGQQQVDMLVASGANVNSQIGNLSSNLTSLQNSSGINQDAALAKLGINPSQMAGLSPQLASKLTSDLSTVASTIPENTDIAALGDKGLIFDKLGADQLQNLPVIQPPSISPSPLVDQATIMKDSFSGGITNPVGQAMVGSEFGNLDAVMGSVVSSNDLVNGVVASSNGMANNIGSFGQNAVNLGAMPASVGIGSVESNIMNVNNIAQVPPPSTLGVSLNNQYGSLQASPLAKLISDKNNNGN